MLAALLPLSAVPALAAGFTENFDDSSGFVTSTPFFSDGGWDYFGITDGATGDFGGGALPAGLKPYTGFSGSFLAGMDLDAEGASVPFTIDWTGIDITGLASIEFSGDFAEFFDDPGDIDEPDFILVEYQIDGGGYLSLLSFVGADFTSSSGPFNGFFKEDTDFDGVGDGATLGNAAQTFTKSVPGTGTALDLRLTVSVDSGDEDFAVDSFSIGEAVTPSGPELVINEVMQNPAAVGDGAGEWFEVYNPTSDAVDINGWTMKDNDFDSHVINNGGPLLVPAGGYLVLGNNADSSTNGGATVDYSYGSGWFLSNSADEVVLLDGSLAEVDRIEYDNGATFPDPNGSSMALTDPTLDNNVGANWCESGTAFGDGDFGSPGAANDCYVAPPEPTAYKIHEIQGAGDTSDKVGEFVEIEGVVVGDFQGTATDDQFSGFHVQEQDDEADGDPMTSEGIFVYAPGAMDVSIGDVVTVHGTVAEFFGLTEITDVVSIVVGGTGSASASPVSLPITAQSDWEKYEGMLVMFSQDLFITEFFNYDRFGEIVLATERQYQGTQVEEPGPDALAVAAANALARVRLDDGQEDQNPEFSRHPAGGEFTLSHRFRGGDIIRDLTGVVDYAFGSYKIQPTQDAVFIQDNPRTLAPEVGGTVKVAAFNVLNFFTHLDDGTNDVCGPLAINECRGADTAEEYVRQRDKIVAGIIGLDADVVGLMEIENDILEGGLDPFGDRAHDPVLALVEALNAVAGAGTYAWNGPADYYNDYPVTNEIIYKPAVVTPVGQPVALQDLAFDGVRPYSSSPTDPVGRPPMAQTFVDSNGEKFTVVANHFKSKGSGCTDGVFDPADPGTPLWLDPGSTNGQGNCPLTRVKQAEALIDWLATDPTDSGDPDVLIIGDLNAYALEDPIDVITGAGYTNLLSFFQGLDEYTYVFDGQLGNLDHALGSSSILGQVTGTAAWHINSDEPDILDYDMSFKSDEQDLLYEPNAYRASDHDPVIVGLMLDSVPPELAVEVAPDELWPPNHKYVTVEALVTAADNSGLPVAIDLISVTSTEADCCLGYDDLPNDIVIIDDFTFDLRAERYDKMGRYYTITYMATDWAGNTTMESATIYVPHSKGLKFGGEAE
jgi:predicted extracellular nuclease